MYCSVPASEAGLWDEKERRGERCVGAMERCPDLEREERGKLGLVLVLHPRLACRRSRGVTVERANVLSYLAAQRLRGYMQGELGNLVNDGTG